MIDSSTMSTARATELGRIAYEDGRGSSPLADPEIRDALECVQAGKGRRVMKAYVEA